MKTSELQRAAELELQREDEEKFRNATRYSKWLQKKRRLKDMAGYIMVFANARR